MKSANNAPVYLGSYAAMAEVARRHGYAMAVHGSLARDCDLICIPWREYPRPHAEVVEAMVKRFCLNKTSGPTKKPHGRTAYTLHISYGDCYFDLQFMPAERYDDSAPDDAINPSRA